jgi:V8-like Glu-specific endopeptidase
VLVGVALRSKHSRSRPATLLVVRSRISNCSRSLLFAIISAGSLGSLSLGCSQDVEHTPANHAFGKGHEAIEGGTSAEAIHNVVGLRVQLPNNGIEICTGALIAPDLVLTAQHCVATNTEQIQCGMSPLGPQYPVGSISVTTESIISSKAKYYAVQSIQIPPGGNDLCGNDLALLVLKTAIPASEAVPLIPRVNEAVFPLTNYVAVGYGATDAVGNGALTRRQRGGLSITCVGEECPWVLGNGNRLVSNSEWYGDTGICFGDSGGPALDDQQRVIGIVSRGDQDCGGPIYGSLYSWSDWLKEETKKQAISAGYTIPSWVTEAKQPAPIGSSGGSGSNGSGGSSPTGKGGAGTSVGAGGAGGTTQKAGAGGTTTSPSSSSGFCSYQAGSSEWGWYSWLVVAGWLLRRKKRAG